MHSAFIYKIYATPKTTCSSNRIILLYRLYIVHLPTASLPSFYKSLKAQAHPLWVRSLMRSPQVNDINVSYSRNALNNTVIITLAVRPLLLLLLHLVHYTASRRPYALYTRRDLPMCAIATSTAPTTVAIGEQHIRTAYIASPIQKRMNEKRLYLHTQTQANTSSRQKII